MSLPLIVRPEAEEDLGAAGAWYDSKLPGLGDELLLSIDATMGHVQRTPRLYPVVHREVRRALTQRFPFGVYFLLEDARVVVIAVLHLARDPDTWRQRR